MGPLSPRSHVLRKMLSVSRDAAPEEPAGTSVDPPLPNLGDMQLYSFYEPSLHAGTYTITAKQKITIPGEATIPDETCPTQEFTVIAPQFVIPPADIHSTYPPQGHADQPNVLPHIVFSDPHLPWERLGVASDSVEFALPDNDINKIPWLALLVFDCNGPDQELRLSTAQLNTPNSLFPSSIQFPIKQSTNFAVNMTVEQYMSLPTPVPAPEGFSGTKVTIPAFTKSDYVGNTTPVDVVFLNATLFNAFFASTSDPSKVDVTRYKYLSHVRNVNTAGMASSEDLGEGTGLFSIVHSHRTGPWDVKEGAVPRSQVVHLVSIEHVSEMTTMPSGTDLVGLVSLYSWTYLCQPPLSVNFVDSMRAIGFQLKNQGPALPPRNTCLLRAPDEICFPSKPDVAPVTPPAGADPDTVTDFKSAQASYIAKKRILSRLRNGYSLLRYRAASGEETIAFNRGPLVPVVVSRISPQWPLSSNNGQCYQILDPDLGVMDISYSSAWQLGKTLAIGDSAFVAALMRVRGEAWTAGVSSANESVAVQNGFKTKSQVLSGLHSTVTSLGSVHGLQTPTANQRWRDTTSVTPRPSFNTGSAHPEVVAGFARGIKEQVTKITLGTNPEDPNAVHNELTGASSPDWGFVHSWIMDKLYLASIPNHYLITDPSHLPPESIRFFCIDPTWMDCLIDGALSVANHLSRGDDAVRLNLKQRFNEYLTTNLHDQKLPHFPQIPIYGFFLRSKVVSVFPDLTVSAPYPANGHQGERVEVLSTRHMGKDVLMVLLDRYPDGGELDSIIISQPPHQQCFSAGDSLNDTKIEFLFRKIYPKGYPPPSGVWDDLTPNGNIVYNSDSSRDPPSQPKPIYSWQTRCLDMDVFADLLTFPQSDGRPGGLLQQNMPGTPATPAVPAVPASGSTPAQPAIPAKPAVVGPWVSPNDYRMTSSMVGLELTDTIMFLEMNAPSLGTDKTKLQNFSPTLGDARQLWTGQNASSNVGASSVQSKLRTPAIGSGSSDATTLSKAEANLRLSSTGKAISTPISLPSVSHPAPIDPSPSKFISNAAGARAVDIHSAVTSTTRDSGSTGPQYTFAVFPSTTPASSFPVRQVPSFVYTDCPTYVDLIFSLTQVKNVTPQNLDLYSIEIRIPLGPASGRTLKTDIPGPGLMDTYTGPGARMLSNQRFVVHIDLELPKMLILRLFPRTLSFTTKLYSNPDVSFRLNGCAISPVTKDGKLVGTKVIETYRKRLGTTPETWLEEGIGQNNFLQIEKKVGWKPPTAS